jgi:glycosyltransferase involved in cell wall biosynthesis
MSEVSPVIWYIHPSAGGPGIGSYDRPYELARAWSALGARPLVIAPGFHHLLETRENLKGRKSVSGVEYYFTRSMAYTGNGLRRILAMWLLMVMIVAERRAMTAVHGEPDVVIASSPHPFPLLSALVLRWIYGSKVVFEVRDIWPASIVELTNVGPRNPFILLLAWIERLAARRADLVVSLLEHAMGHYAKLGVEPARFLFVPNGLPPESVGAGADSPHDAAFEALRQSGKLIVTYGGMLGVANNIDVLLDAAHLLRERGVDGIHIAVIGDGVRREQLVRRREAENLTNVTIFGKVGKAAFRGLLGRSHVGFISLQDSPLFAFGVSPNKVFDYMLAGLPILFAIRSPGNVVERSGCGVCVEPTAEAIAEGLIAIAALSAEERRRLGAIGHAYARANHGYDSLAARYLQRLGRLISGGR